MILYYFTAPIYLYFCV